MNQENAAAIGVIRQLIKRGEFKLAFRVADYNLRTKIIMYKTDQLYLKSYKLRALAKKHSLRIDNLLKEEAMLTTF